MFDECRSVLMLLTPWTAPKRRVCHREKGQYHRTGQFYLTDRSAACSQLLTASETGRPEKNASSCDPDKGPTERQVAGSRRSEIGRQRSAAFARGEEMAKEMSGDEEDDAGCSTEPGVQEPEMRRGHFL